MTIHREDSSSGCVCLAPRCGDGQRAIWYWSLEGDANAYTWTCDHVDCMDWAKVHLEPDEEAIAEVVAEALPEQSVPAMPHQRPGIARTFDTGATRDSDDGKYDYEGFLSPLVLERFAQYMHENRVQSDGQLRDSDNWQKGIPRDQYMKSMFRHFMEVWTNHRIGRMDEDALCALMFNVMGYLFEWQDGR